MSVTWDFISNSSFFLIFLYFGCMPKKDHFLPRDFASSSIKSTRKKKKEMIK